MKEMKRVVVVTGGGSGMGRAIAQRFADNGDTIYIVGRRLEKLEETAKGYGNILCVQADVTKPKDINRAVAAITKTHKNVDVLINCAGASGTIDPELPLKDALQIWRGVIDANLTSSFLMIHAMRPYITRPGGRIINIGSLAAFAGSSRPGGLGYAAAKSGLHGLNRTLVKEFAPHGVTVNCIAPGLIDDTEFFGGDGVPEDRKARYLSAIPAGRVGEPREVAGTAFFLASEQAGYINGEILNVNGGSQFGR